MHHTLHVYPTPKFQHRALSEMPKNNEEISSQGQKWQTVSSHIVTGFPCSDNLEKLQALNVDRPMN